MEKALSRETIINEMRIPKSVSETIFEVTMYGIVVFFVILAIFNLVFLRPMSAGALVCSVIWLLCVFLTVASVSER
jgi:hypothetical protein